MTTAVACCGTPTPYFDKLDNETRCRSCGRSLSLPATTPDAQLLAEVESQGSGNPRAKVDAPIMCCCVRCRLEISCVRQYCPGCEQQIVVFQSQTIRGGAVYVLPPFNPPRSLRCSCCKQLLPQSAFARDRNRPNRDYRNSRCRGCASFRARVRWQNLSESGKAVQRQQQQDYRDRAKAEGRVLGVTDKAARAAAGRRSWARKSGKSAPLLQRRGRLSIHVKPICRVADSCPLRSFCTVESKGVG